MSGYGLETGVRVSAENFLFNSIIIIIINIIFHHPLTMLNDFICGDNLEGAISSPNHRLLVCYVVTLL